ncbi:hypothetical protein SFUMM280S_09657 [Streptomyces fumanus]
MLSVTLVICSPSLVKARVRPDAEVTFDVKAPEYVMVVALPFLSSTLLTRASPVVPERVKVVFCPFLREVRVKDFLSEDSVRSCL